MMSKHHGQTEKKLSKNEKKREDCIGLWYNGYCIDSNSNPPMFYVSGAGDIWDTYVQRNHRQHGAGYQGGKPDLHP